jgi:Acyl-CoA hydrolase
MTFHLPVNVGDLVSCYSQVTRVGRTSLTVKIDAWVQRRIGRHMERVTSGSFTYVAVDEKGDRGRCRRRTPRNSSCYVPGHL